MFPVAVALTTILLGSLRISGTSVGVYNMIFYGKDFHDPNLLFGQPQLIRTDEWMLQTPWTIAQARTRFSQDNPLYVPTQNLATMNVPVANWIAVFKPWLWPFFVLPLEYAFALSWWVRSAMLVLASYWLLMIITRRDSLLSALGALALLFSPYFQWWYESPASLIDIASCALLASLFARQIVLESRSAAAMLWGVLFAYFTLCFAFILYPAGQIPVALGCLLIGVGAALANPGYVGPARLGRVARTLGIAGILVCLGLVAFRLDFGEIIAIIRQTIYPGQRSAMASGNLTVLQLLGGVYDVFLLRGFTPHAMGENQSEAASFFMLSIFLLPVLLFSLIHRALTARKTDTILLGAIGFCLLLFSWILVGFPDAIARILLLQFVPAARAWLAAGLVNFLLIYYYLCRHDFQMTRSFKTFAWLYSGAVLLLVWRAGVVLQADAPDFIQGKSEIAVIATISATMLQLLLLKRRYAFGALLLFFSLVSTIRVNPLYVGLSPVLNSDFAQAIQRIGRQDDGQSVWAVYDHDYGNYLAANGVKVLGGTYAYPDMEFWRRLDPLGKYVDVYNRFSHTLITRAEAPDGVEFRLLSREAVQLLIDPCSATARDLNLNYFVFFDPAFESCLRRTEQIHYPNLDIYIYRRLE